MLQISIPRGGSNAVARMLGQSPDVAEVVRSQILTGGITRLQSAATEVAREHPGRLLYVKEHAAVLTPDRFELFSAADRFLFVIRDPARQYASALVAVASSLSLLGTKLSAQRGRPVRPAQLATTLDEYAATVLPTVPEPVDPGGEPGDLWRHLVDYTRRSHDFQPISGMLSSLFQRQPEPQACGSELEWFDQSLFLAAMRSWSASVRLATLLQAMDASRVAVIDFSVLQARPWVIAEVCERLELRYHPRMVTGPWRPVGRWFDAGLEFADGYHWVERARSSTRLEPSRPVAYDPMTLPEVARRAFLPSLDDYLRLLRHPGYVGPRSPEQVERFLAGRDRRPGDGAAAMGEDPGGPGPREDPVPFLAGNPVAAWALACVATCADAPLTRAVEDAHPGLSRFFDTARQLISGAECPWQSHLPSSRR